MTLNLLSCFRLATVSLSLAATASGVHSQAIPYSGSARCSVQKAVNHLNPKTTALVIIDFQKEYFFGRMPIPDGQRAMENAQRLMAFADQAGIPVFLISHVDAMTQTILNIAST